MGESDRYGVEVTRLMVVMLLAHMGQRNAMLHVLNEDYGVLTGIIPSAFHLCNGLRNSVFCVSEPQPLDL